MRFAILSTLAVGALFAIGCASGAHDWAPREGAPRIGSARLERAAAPLVGAYQFSENPTRPGAGDFYWLVLKADQRFLTGFATDAEVPRLEGSWAYDGVTLTLTPSSSPADYPVRHMVVTTNASGMYLSGDGIAAHFDRIESYCEAAADCEGQGTRQCANGATPTYACTPAQRCESTCGVGGATNASTDNTPTASNAPCIATGCGGTVCADHDVWTTCEYYPSDACYEQTAAVCERQLVNGSCGWRDTPELRDCLARFR